MAKANKPADEITPAFGPDEAAMGAQTSAPPAKDNVSPSGLSVPDAETADRGALLARIAELESMLETATAPNGSPVQPPAGTLPRFLVKIQHAPSWVVEAESAGLAFEAYKAATGLIATPYPVEVLPSEAELGHQLNV